MARYASAIAAINSAVTVHQGRGEASSAPQIT